MRIPNPAMRVTIDVPPKLTSGSGTPTTGTSPGDHRGIHEHINEKRQADAAGEQPGKRVSCLRCDVQAAADDEQVKAEQYEHTEQPQFLAHDGKDEVGIAFRQELELRLAAVRPAFAEQSARAYRDLRLNDVVAGAQRIGVGVEQGQYALLLVVLHELPQQPGAGHRRPLPSRIMTRIGSPASTMTSTRRTSAISKDVPRSGWRAMSTVGTTMSTAMATRSTNFGGSCRVVQEPRGHHRHRELHDFGWLEADTDIQPALRALADFAAYQHEYQQDESGR